LENLGSRAFRNMQNQKQKQRSPAPGQPCPGVKHKPKNVGSNKTFKKKNPWETVRKRGDQTGKITPHGWGERKKKFPTKTWFGVQNRQFKKKRGWWTFVHGGGGGNKSKGGLGWEKVEGNQAKKSCLGCGKGTQMKTEGNEKGHNLTTEGGPGNGKNPANFPIKKKTRRSPFQKNNPPTLEKRWFGKNGQRNRTPLLRKPKPKRQTWGDQKKPEQDS